MRGLGDLTGRVRPHRARRQMRRRRLAAHVVHHQLMPALLLQIGRHAGAHGAEPDEPDLHAFFSSKTCLTTFAADIALGQPE